MFKFVKVGVATNRGAKADYAVRISWNKDSTKGSLGRVRFAFTEKSMRHFGWSPGDRVSLLVDAKKKAIAFQKTNLHDGLKIQTPTKTTGTFAFCIAASKLDELGLSIAHFADVKYFQLDDIEVFDNDIFVIRLVDSFSFGPKKIK